MKSVNNKRKWICLLIILALMLQSCRAYVHKPVTLDEAADFEGKTKIVFNNGSKRHFKKIERIDNAYYGVLRESDANKENPSEIYRYSQLTGNIVPRVPLNENEIKSVRTLDKTATTFGNIGIVLGSLVVVLTAAAAISFANSDLY